MLKYGKIVKDIDSTVYTVQSTFGRERFGSYYATTYTTKNDPGAAREKLFINRHLDLKAKLLGVKEGLSFSDPAAAFECARLLENEGRIVCGWEGTEEWRKEYHAPIKTRVVEERLRHIHRIVHSNEVE